MYQIIQDAESLIYHDQLNCAVATSASHSFHNQFHTVNALKSNMEIQHEAFKENTYCNADITCDSAGWM